MAIEKVFILLSVVLNCIYIFIASYASYVMKHNIVMEHDILFIRTTDFLNFYKTIILIVGIGSSIFLILGIVIKFLKKYFKNDDTTNIK